MQAIFTTSQNLAILVMRATTAHIVITAALKKMTRTNQVSSIAYCVLWCMHGPISCDKRISRRLSCFRLACGQFSDKRLYCLLEYLFGL